MTRSELEIEAEERLFEAALDDVVRESAELTHNRKESSPSRLVAMFVLLGLAVVVGVIATSGSTPTLAVTPQEPKPLPPAVKAIGVAALKKVNRTTQNLWCKLDRPGDLALLREFPRLRGLHIAKRRGPSVTDPAWSRAILAECPQLEWLSVGYFGNGRAITRDKPSFDAADLAQLTSMRHLRSLVLGGVEKVIDTKVTEVLHKLELRSLVLHAVHCTPEGLRSLGELPVLERLTMWNCTGLEDCDLRHLLRLGNLRSLELRGVGGISAARMSQARVGGLSALLKPAPKPPLQLITAKWMQKAATALPLLRELDLRESLIDDEVLVALPRKLTFLGLRNVVGFGELGVAAVSTLPSLQGLAFGEWSTIAKGSITADPWPSLLRQRQLQRIEFTGVLTPEFVAALKGQTELRHLRLRLETTSSFKITGRGKTPETPIVLAEAWLPDFTFLAKLPHLKRVELAPLSEALEKAIRQAVPESVLVARLER